MTKTQLLNAVQGKIGFHSIVKDEVAPDNIIGDPIEKRYLYVNHLNGDGTMGKTYIYYLLDTATQEAWFYNLETENLDNKEHNSEQKKLDALQAYLDANFDAYFIVRYDTTKNWAQADVFTQSGQDLTQSKVLVFKPAQGAITHKNIV